jgi:hypothetical protein
MNNRKMKLKRSNEIRNLEEFTPEEIDEIKNITRQPEISEEIENLGFANLKLEVPKEETSV